MEKDSTEQCFCLRRQYSRLTADLNAKCLGVCRGKDVTIFNLIMQVLLKGVRFHMGRGHISFNIVKNVTFFLENSSNKSEQVSEGR